MVVKLPGLVATVAAASICAAPALATPPPPLIGSHHSGDLIAPIDNGFQDYLKRMQKRNAATAQVRLHGDHLAPFLQGVDLDEDLRRRSVTSPQRMLKWPRRKGATLGLAVSKPNRLFVAPRTLQLHPRKLTKARPLPSR